METENEAICRNQDRAQQLAESLGGSAEAVSLEDIASGAVSGNVLINTTAVGMAPNEDSPVPASALAAYHLVFDAVYTPVETTLLKVNAEARAFRLYTRLDGP